MIIRRDKNNGRYKSIHAGRSSGHYESDEADALHLYQSGDAPRCKDGEVLESIRGEPTGFYL